MYCEGEEDTSQGNETNAKYSIVIQWYARIEGNRD
jgi:hypothetical protein